MSGETTNVHWIENMFAYHAPTPEVLPVLRACRHQFFGLAVWLHDRCGPRAMEAIVALHRAMMEANWAIAQSCPIAERLVPAEPEVGP